MKSVFSLAFALLAAAGFSSAGVRIDEQALGDKLGGWTKRGKQAAEYPLSGSTYCTFKPEVSPTPDGGIFVSLRIDHVRGWLSSNDHAVLEITISSAGNIVSAQSNIAIQGRSITSDLIRGGTEAGQQVAGVDRAVEIGTDLVADLSEKLLREKIVEAGRVSFPAALRHNYNLLYQAIRNDPPPAQATAETVKPADGGAVVTPPAAPQDGKPAENKPQDAKLEIRNFDKPAVDLPVKK